MHATDRVGASAGGRIAWLAIAAAVVAAAGCKYRDPLFCRSSADCTDPTRPVCDTTGSMPASNGIANTCVAVAPVDDAGVRDAADDREKTVAMIAGSSHACAISDRGNLKCWGDDDYTVGGFGKLGYGVELDNIGDDDQPVDYAPVDIGGSVVSASAQIFHTCVALDEGAVRCWGVNFNGRVGAPGQARDIVPSSVDPIELNILARQVSVGANNSCLLTPGGNVHCWGAGATLGHPMEDIIGDDEPPSAVGPLALDGLAIQVALGHSHACAVLESGDVRCWGAGAFGKLGTGNTDAIGDDEAPSAGVVDLGGREVVQIAAGEEFTCARLVDGTVRCWGRGRDGAHGYMTTDDLGDDEPIDPLGPVQIGGAASFIAAGYRHVCAIIEQGRLRCWGDAPGHREPIGDDELPATAPDIDVGGPVIHVACGLDFTCAVLTTGDVRCWGINDRGQLGLGPGFPAEVAEPQLQVVRIWE